MTNLTHDPNEKLLHLNYELFTRTVSLELASVIKPALCSALPSARPSHPGSTSATSPRVKELAATPGTTDQKGSKDPSLGPLPMLFSHFECPRQVPGPQTRASLTSHGALQIFSHQDHSCLSLSFKFSFQTFLSLLTQGISPLFLLTSRDQCPGCVGEN